MLSNAQASRADGNKLFNDLAEAKHFCNQGLWRQPPSCTHTRGESSPDKYPFPKCPKRHVFTAGVRRSVTRARVRTDKLLMAPRVLSCRRGLRVEFRTPPAR
jgi:hypothetical protein